jgi:hypothetical protein
MATWRAKCWLGSSSGYQDLEVQSNTAYGAKEQFQRIYGAEQIINLHEVRDSSVGSAISSGGSIALVAFLFVVWLIIEYWYFVIPGAIILGLLYWYGRNA